MNPGRSSSESPAGRGTSALPSAQLDFAARRTWPLIPSSLPVPTWWTVTLALAAGALCGGLVRLIVRNVEAPVCVGVVVMMVALLVLLTLHHWVIRWWLSGNATGRWYAAAVGDEGLWLDRRRRAGRLVSFETLSNVSERSAIVLIESAESGGKPAQTKTLHRCRLERTTRRAVDLQSTEPGLADALNAALSYYQSLHPPPDLAALMPPPGADDAWLDRLSKMLSASGDYRSARASVDQLVAIATHPRAKAAQRVAAACALHGADQDTLDRVSRAADAVAHPTLADGLRAGLSATLSWRAFREATASR